MKYLTLLKKDIEKTETLINKHIKKAFKKHERIHEKCEKGVYKYDADRVETCINFIESNFYLTTGDLEKIKLNAVQKWWLELLTGYYTNDDELLFNEFFLLIIRGAGKSTFMAAFELYWMFLSGKYGGASRVIAYDNIQADHVFNQVKNQITTGDGLFKSFGDTKRLKTTKTGIELTINKNEFKKQTNDINRAQGGNTSLNIFDEVHIYKDDIVSTINKGSRQKQKSWQSLYITSGGIVRGKLFDSLFDRFSSDDEFENNDRSFACLYCLDDVSEVHDSKNWTKAAPMLKYGIPKLEGVEEEYRLAKDDPLLQTQFLAYNMGMRMNDVTKYIQQNEAERTAYDFDAVWSGANVVVGVDVALVGDLTALTFITEVDDVMYAHCECIASNDTLKRLDPQTAKFLKSCDNLTITDTTYTTADQIFDVFVNFVNRYNVTTEVIAYDPAKYEILKSLIDNYFFDVDDDRQVKIKQGFAMSDYIKLMKELLNSKTLIHDDRLLGWSLLNTAVRLGTSGDVMLKKLNNNEKIDPVVALVNALKIKIEKRL